MGQENEEKAMEYRRDERKGSGSFRRKRERKQAVKKTRKRIRGTRARDRKGYMKE